MNTNNKLLCTQGIWNDLRKHHFLDKNHSSIISERTKRLQKLSVNDYQELTRINAEAFKAKSSFFSLDIYGIIQTKSQTKYDLFISVCLALFPFKVYLNIATNQIALLFWREIFPKAPPRRHL